MKINFSHTTGSHAKPNHTTAMPSQTMQLDDIPDAEDAEVGEFCGSALTASCQMPCRRVGGWEVRTGQRWQTATRKVSNLMSHVTYTPHTLAPRLPDVCEKNVFPQPAENNTFEL